MDQIITVLSFEVLKREVIDGEGFLDATKLLARAAHNALRDKHEEDDDSDEKLPKESAPVPFQPLTP